ncbi:MAG: hypothetical protein GC131_08390 [Alphaproteobacteria bacterium]|nr:hypothetical protein [Alphaproteobacteria bacterium]
MKLEITMPKAALFGAVAAALAAFAFIATLGAAPAEAQRTGPYQIMHHSNTTANAGVFRLDTVSGEVSYCYVTGEALNAQSKLVCTQASR